VSRGGWTRQANALAAASLGAIAWAASRLAPARVERTVPLVFSISGETFDVGIGAGFPVGLHPRGHPCTAEITGVTLERLDSPPPKLRQVIREASSRQPPHGVSCPDCVSECE
jgi:hypothetical protein